MADELLFTVEGSEAALATPISLPEAGLKEREDLQEWVLAHPQILGPGVMVVTFEFDRWWSQSGAAPLDRLDVLGLDESGRLVVVELKRDKASDTVEMQAIKYAAMVSRFTPDVLASQHARFLAQRGETCSEADAMDRLLAHAEALDVEILRRPRIILVANDFPPVVTATVVWLNEMEIDVTLVQFQAYRAGDKIVLSVSQVYPIQDVEDFTVTPRQAEIRAAVATKKRTQETSAVRRLVKAGSLPDGTELTLHTTSEVNAEIRTALESWVEEDPARTSATWRNDAQAPLRWKVDGKDYSPTGLVRHMIAESAGVDRSVQGTKWWVDGDGNDLVELSASGRGRMYLAFWTRFLERLREEHPDWSKAEIPQPDSWFDMPAPIKGTHFSVNFTQGGRIRSELYIDNGDAEANLTLLRSLETQKSELEAAFGVRLEWEELPGKQACRIAHYGEGDVAEVDAYDEYIDWFFDSTERFRTALAGIAVA